MNKSEAFLTPQTILLMGGTGFAWYTVYTDITVFYNTYGTLLRFADCTPPNPFAQACFYGAFAFLASFIWSLRLLQGKSPDTLKSQRYLLYLLSFGTIFAWSNFAYMAYSHYHATVNSFTCTVGADNSLYTTPLLYRLGLVSAFLGGRTCYVAQSAQGKPTLVEKQQDGALRRPANTPTPTPSSLVVCA
jgi:hypothetical protein